MAGRPQSPPPDPKVLRAVAHPTRGRILAELGAAGSLRAADIARALGIPANQASFHLRQLAKYGLVEEDPEAGRDRRDRVWRPVQEGGIELRLGDFETDTASKAAVTVFRRSTADWGRFLVERAMGLHDAEPHGVSRQLVDTAVRLTEEEREELAGELTDLVDRWTRRTRGAGDDRTTYSLLMVLQDYPEGPRATD